MSVLVLNDISSTYFSIFIVCRSTNLLLNPFPRPLEGCDSSKQFCRRIIWMFSGLDWNSSSQFSGRHMIVGVTGRRQQTGISTYTITHCHSSRFIQEGSECFYFFLCRCLSSTTSFPREKLVAFDPQRGTAVLGFPVSNEQRRVCNSTTCVCLQGWRPQERLAVTFDLLSVAKNVTADLANMSSGMFSCFLPQCLCLSWGFISSETLEGGFMPFSF